MADCGKLSTQVLDSFCGDALSESLIALKKKFGAIWFTRPNILIMYHRPFGSMLIKRKVNASSWFLCKVPMCSKIEIMEFGEKLERTS